MTEKHFSKTNALVASSLLTLGTSMPITAGVGSNPFEIKILSSGYQVAHEEQKRTPESHDKDRHESNEKEEHSGDHDSKDDQDSKSSEGKCGADHMKENEGKCGGMK